MNKLINNKRVFFYFRNISITFLVFSVIVLLLQQSCKKEDECFPPVIDSITFSGDSISIDTLVPTRKITIHGTHFKGISKITINDLSYNTLGLYFTDTSMTFTVPYATANTDSYDSLVLVKSCGNAIKRVTVLSAPPYITHISNEFAVAGDVITLQGDYFIYLKKVTFPGEIEGEIVEGYCDSVCQVIVPEGVNQQGEIVLTSLSGDGSSAYNVHYYDVTGLLCDFDYNNYWEGWGGNVIRNANDASIPPANGFFFVFESSNILPGTDEIESSILPVKFYESPDYSGELSPNYFAIQAEMYLEYPWKCGQYNILIGKKSAAGSVEYSYEYNYRPWSDTTNAQGEFKIDGWVTVTIPLTKFMLSGSSTIPLQSYSQLRLANYMKWSFVNPDEEEGGKPITHFKIALDNLRLVQIKEEE